MRVLLLILMMALLPLRAGLGDVMAMEDARAQAQVELHPAAAHDCHEAQRLASQGETAPHAPSHVSADGTQTDHACSDCTVCHVTALPGTLLPQMQAAAGSALPPAQVTRHVSADPVPGLKPPIA
jgi:hypothetical protein